MRKKASGNLADLAMDLKINLRERCTTTCLLSTYCAQREPENPAVFGNVGVRALATIKIDEISANRKPSRLHIGTSAIDSNVLA